MASFTEQFNASVLKIRAHAEQVAKNVVVAVGDSVVDKSPYGEPDLWKRSVPDGYVPGQFRGSWHHNLGAPSDDQTAVIDASGDTSRAEIVAGAAAQPFGAHYITNNLPYAYAMEAGGAWWAITRQPVATAMVGLTANEFPQIVRNAMAEIGA